jgi:V8-like Glu-specific endopeptidase
LFASVVVLVSLGLGVAPASAAGAASESSSTPTESTARINGQVVRDAATAQRLIEAYWTPERMRSAIPWNPEGVVDDAQLEQRDRPGNVGRPETDARPAGPSAAGGAPAGVAPKAVNTSPGVGKVFFSKAGGGNYVCSGSTINNPTRNVVSTAAHCIHGGKGGTDHENWMYAPLYHNGSTPHGKWPAKYFHATQGWTKHSYHWWDFAFVNVWPVGGVRLVEKTGGNGISFNQSKQIKVTALAYPSAAPYDGTKQIYCQADMHWAAAAQVKIFCGLTPGASGGPMFQNYDNNIRFGFTNSVVAYVWGSRNYGPYFDSDVRTVYNRAKNKA